MRNKQIAQLFSSIADILELQAVPFKPQAYRRAALTIEGLQEDIEEIYKRNELEEIPGIGKSLAEKIEEVIKTGKLDYYDYLKKKTKIDIENLRSIPGLGPKKIKVLNQKLGIRNLFDLEEAIKKKKIQKLAHFGEKSEQVLLKGLEYLKTKPHRLPYAQVYSLAQELLTYFKQFSFVEKVEICGSFRREEETIGDLDVLVVSKKPKEVMNAFVTFSKVKEVLSQGPTKTSVRITDGFQIDLRVVNEKQFGSALLYFTGSKEHNIELRRIALSKGYTLSEYGLFTLKDKRWIAGRTEEEIYKKLGLYYVLPKQRKEGLLRKLTS